MSSIVSLQEESRDGGIRL